MSFAQTTRALLGGVEPPTALIYDDALMAVAGLGTVQEPGFVAPDHRSVAAWDDSSLCRAARPALAAIRRDVPERARLAESLPPEAVAGGSARHVPSRGEQVARTSTAQAPQGRALGRGSPRPDAVRPVLRRRRNQSVCGAVFAFRDSFGA